MQFWEENRDPGSAKNDFKLIVLSDKSGGVSRRIARCRMLGEEPEEETAVARFPELRNEKNPDHGQSRNQDSSLSGYGHRRMMHRRASLVQ